MSEPTPVPDEPNDDETAGPGGQDAEGHGVDGQDLDAHSREVMRWRAQSRRRRAASGVPADDTATADDGAAGENADEAAGDPVGGGARAATSRRSRRARAARKKRPWWVELPVMIVIAFLATFLIQTFIARVYYVPSGSMEQTLHGVQHGGDRILAYKLGYDFGSPQQGDVVVFKGPPSWAPEASLPGPSTWLGKIAQAVGGVVGIAPADEKDFVKRVIAVGGQTVSCCDVKGRVQVNGVSLSEPYIYQPIDENLWDTPGFHCEADPGDPGRYNSNRCFGPYTVPQGYLWVMGDHRSDSSDSSFNCQGLTEEAMRERLDPESGQPQCGRPIPVKDVVGRAVAIVMPPSRWGGVGSPDIMGAATGTAGQ